MNPRTIAGVVARAASAAGKGALAGAAATAVMTVSSTVEMKLRDRRASSAPVSAGGKVLGVQPRNPAGAARFGNFVHWSYGTAWGTVGGLLRLGVPEPLASLAHFASVWGTEITMLPALEVTPPIPEWSAGEVAVDLFHHAVYAASFAGAWFLLGMDQPEESLLSRLLSGVR